MKKVFTGVVSFGDEYRCRDEDYEGAVFIGEADVVMEIAEEFNGRVTIGIADARFDGELSVETGWGYTEWTPIDSDKLEVGSHNIINILERYGGQTVTMWVSDEPINLLDDTED